MVRAPEPAALLPINLPSAYAALSVEDQAALAAWIAAHIQPSRRRFKQTSYGLKHVFERSPSGFYVTNGAFKGAMQAAGYAAIDETVVNWSYRIAEATTGCLTQRAPALREEGKR